MDSERLRMLGFLSKLFGKAKVTVPRESEGLRVLVPDSRTHGRREPSVELDWSQAEYIPLPPSPPTWEVDGRDEFHREYNDPSIGPVFQAGFKNRYTKVVKLAAGLPSEQRQGQVGKVIAKAYAKLIIQRMQSGQLAAAAKRCVEMFERVPDHVKDVDQRRFNRILAQMDSAILPVSRDRMSACKRRPVSCSASGDTGSRVMPTNSVSYQPSFGGNAGASSSCIGRREPATYTMNTRKRSSVSPSFS